MAKITKQAKQSFVDDFFGNKDNSSVNVLYFNPKSEEFFTDKNFAENSKEKNAKGERIGKLEEFARGEEAKESGDVE